MSTSTELVPFVPHVASLRPLVRYVDEAVAVLEVHLALNRELTPSDASPAEVAPQLNVLLELKSPAGGVIEQRARLHLSDRQGLARFILAGPSRWWPAGMGDQVLYDMSVTLLHDEEPLDTWHTAIGLTSVRTPATPGGAVGRSARPRALTMRSLRARELLVNGRPMPIHEVMPIDPEDEQHILPVGADCLLVVRDHFGPDVLYDAADRAGILLIQSVPPAAARASLADQLRAEVDRLAGHPSLAGWLVDRAETEKLTPELMALDPTRGIFRRLPLAG